MQHNHILNTFSLKIVHEKKNQMDAIIVAEAKPAEN